MADTSATSAAVVDRPADEKPDKSSLKSIHKTAMERFRQADEAYSKQAKRELDDLKFASRRGQWTDDELATRKAVPLPGGATMGGRPAMVIDTLRQPLQQLENQQRGSNIAVNVSPSGRKATRKTAEAIQGLYRYIQVTSRADQIARFWAYSRAIKAGRGVYKVEKVFAPFDPETDPPEAAFDQELKISRVLNQAGVLFDPFAQEPDWSDGEWAFEKAWLPQDRYKRRRPDAHLAKADESTFETIGDSEPNWVRKDGDTWSVLVVRYWYVKFTDGEKLTGKEGQKRTLQKRTVCVCEMDAHEITEHEEWDGQYIPLIPVIANEENLDGERIWEGIVAPAKESCRIENFMASAFVETTALAPKSPWLATIEQIGPFKAWWDQSNARNFPYLPYVAKSEGGSQVPPPQRMFGEPPIQAISQGMQMFRGITNAITGFNDPARGNLSMSERSGVALQTLQKQTETGNSGYLDNLAQIAMTYEAKVILDLIPKVYDRPGRIAQILGADDEPSSVMLNAPFAKGPEGYPIPAEDAPPNAELVEYQLKEAIYGSTVKIGKSTTNARDEAAEIIGGIIQAAPQLLMLIGDLYFANLDGPGMPEMAARMKKMLPPQLQEQQGGQPDAAQLQQQIGQMQQALQQLQPMADANQAKLQQAQMEMQAKAQQAQAETESRERIAQMETQAKIEIEKVKANLALETARLKAMADTQTAAGKSQADLQKAALQEAAETERQQAEDADEAAKQARDLQHTREMADHAVVNRPEPSSEK